MALLSRRWGQTPRSIAESLTPDEFTAYLEIEVRAQKEDRMVAASGVLAAIAQAFGGKKARSMSRFSTLLDGEKQESSASKLHRQLQEHVGARAVPRKDGG